MIVACRLFKSRLVSQFTITTTLLFCAAALALLVSCTTKLDESQTVVRDGLVYKVGATKPFSGIVTGKGREGYRKQICTFEKQYEDGVLNGRTKYWYQNGKLESIVPYENGDIHGVVTRYHDNGKTKARIHFENGFRGGSKGEYFYDEEGRPIKG